MKRVRVLLGKAGLDGHDRGILILAKALRDAHDQHHLHEVEHVGHGLDRR